MSVRSVPLFTKEGRGTPLMFAQWVRRGPLQPINTALRLVTEEGLPTIEFRGLWVRAFPSRPPLPQGPVARDDGAATDAFWFLFS